jgi:integration host factor subunit alpha
MVALTIHTRSLPTKMALTKSTIIEEISHRLELSPAEAKHAIEALLETMKSTLASGEDVMVSGFGRFQVNDKAPRKGRNPATGDSMTLDKRRVVTFKCSGKLRDQINGKIHE